MTPEVRARIAHRTRASRLRADLTGLTVLSSLVATAGFGWLAAETYAGTPKPTTTTTTTRTNGTVATPTPTQDESTTPNGSSGSGTSGGVVRGNGSISRSSGRGHVTTGSS